MNKYIINDKIPSLIIHTPTESISINISLIISAIVKANQNISEIKRYKIDIFTILGMRNLSAFVGEVLVAALAETANGVVVKNPHQDGYPDLLAMTEQGKKEWERLKNNKRDKKPFSPFTPGGIEVKATCGSIPTPDYFAKRGLHKSGIGESRIDYIKGYDWKSHHRETNNLLGIFWDFINGIPTIAAIFYSGYLSTKDWGAIIQPKENGGRTTSVSIMNRGGVKRMYDGWVCVVDDDKYINFFNKYNGSNIIAR